MRKLPIRSAFVLSALLASAAWSATATPLGDTVVVHAGEVIVRPGEVLKDVDILIIDGVIRRVEAGLEVPEGAKEITGAVVCAGMIDPWSVLGVQSVEVAFTAASPATRTADSLNPFGHEFQKKQALRSGVTSARVQAARRAMVSGLCSVVSLAPSSDEDFVARADAALSVSIGLTNPASGGTTFVVNPDGTFVVRASGPSAMDTFERIAQVDKVASLLASGRTYRIAQNEFVHDMAKWKEGIEEKVKELEKDFKKAKKDRDKEIEEAKEKGKEFKEERYKEDKTPQAPKFDADKEILAKAVNGEIPIVVEVHRVAEIRYLLEATAPFGRLRMVIAGGTEAGAFAEQLAARKIAVIVNPQARGASAYDEFDGHDAALAGVLAEAGVDVLIGSGGQTAGATRDLPLLAAMAVGEGMEADAAFAAITSGPARVFDLSDRGAVEFGKQADLLILDGQPLSTTTTVQTVLVGGRIVVEPKE